jgi:hypothetical protein
MMSIALGIFVLAHGLVHAILAAAPNPDDPVARAGFFLPRWTGVGCYPG